MYKSNLAVLCLLIFSLSSCKNTQKSNTTDNSEITETAPETRQARFFIGSFCLVRRLAMGTGSKTIT